MSFTTVRFWKGPRLLAGMLLCWASAAHPAPPPAPPASWGGGWGFVGAASTDTNLPRVLLIGDSILNGYRGVVVRELADKANIDVWLNPVHQGSPELHEQLKAVMAQGPYDVVHFNMGLHGFDEGRSRIPEDQFRPLTRKLVATIREGAPKARLIWASSTPMTRAGKPTELEPENDRIILAHNQMAAEVMGEWQIPINDLYALMLDKLQLGRGDTVHWQPAGSAVQGQAVASVIEQQLKTKSSKALTPTPVIAPR